MPPPSMTLWTLCSHDLPSAQYPPWSLDDGEPEWDDEEDEDDDPEDEDDEEDEDDDGGEKEEVWQV